MTTNQLAADVREILMMLTTTTGLRAAAIVKGSSTALGHVATRYAALRMLADRGHQTREIAAAFDLSERNIRHALRKATIHDKPRDIIERARREKNLQTKP